MHPRHKFRPRLFIAVTAFGSMIGSAALARDPAPSVSGAAPPSAVEHPNEAPFLAENEVAMATMMDGMAVRPTGEVDHDFAAMMIPHHQGAIDMAQAELRHGSNEQLRRIAQEIIVDQLQEIAAMRLALGEPLPPSVASPTRPDQKSPLSTAADDNRIVSHDAMKMSPSMNMK
jgi:hypothetical protein